VPIREPVMIEGPSAVHADYKDRSGLRVAGWVTAVAGTVAGAIMIGLSAQGQELDCDSRGLCFERERFEGGLLGAGIGVVLAGAITGSILASQRDEAHVTVAPLTAPSFGSRRESPVAAAGALAPVQGAAVRVRF
jgi:hypothetical protein